MVSNSSRDVGFLDKDFVTQVRDRDGLFIVIVPTAFLLVIAFFLTVRSMIQWNFRCFCRRCMGDTWLSWSRSDVIDLNCCLVVVLNTDEEHIIVHNATSLSGAESNNTCVICFEDFEVTSSNSINILQLNCLHLFHGDCIGKWLKIHRSCPLCKRTVNVTIINKSNGTRVHGACELDRTLTGHAVFGQQWNVILERMDVVSG